MSFFLLHTAIFISTSVAFTHTKLYIWFYPEGFYWGICSWIICLIIYNILFPQIVKIYFLSCIFWIMGWQNEIPKIPSVKTFDSNMSKKLNKTSSSV